MSRPAIDQLSTKKSLIDLSTHSKNTFNSVFIGYDLCAMLDDVMLIEFVDAGGDTSTIVRGGIVVPVNAETNAWRIGKVILQGNNCKLVKQGDHVMFPNNMGVPITNIEVTGHGTVHHGIFLNEQRIFGVVKPRENNDSIPDQPKANTSKRRL
jgi:predicted RecA/RadA family phage recombinase